MGATTGVGVHSVHIPMKWTPNFENVVAPLVTVEAIMPIP